jgi:hypothetical protein
MPIDIDCFPADVTMHLHPWVGLNACFVIDSKLLAESAIV